MSQSQWSAVDQFLCASLIPRDDLLEAVIAGSAAAGLPAIHVSPNLGRLLHLLVKMQGARHVLEIGTLAGYSTIWMARALPEGGQLITLEADSRHAEIAQANLTRAGLADRVSVRVGRAIETLPTIAGSGAPPFDFVFIDADKQSTPEYFEWAIRLARSGSVIVVDNVVRNGAVIDSQTEDASVRGVRRFLEQAGRNSRVEITALQTVGSKGYDGVAIARVL
jgi:predicted O-methyltransferase YrrM